VDGEKLAGSIKFDLQARKIMSHLEVEMMAKAWILRFREIAVKKGMINKRTRAAKLLLMVDP